MERRAGEGRRAGGDEASAGCHCLPPSAGRRPGAAPCTSAAARQGAPGRVAAAARRPPSPADHRGERHHTPCHAPHQVGSRVAQRRRRIPPRPPPPTPWARGAMGGGPPRRGTPPPAPPRPGAATGGRGSAARIANRHPTAAVDPSPVPPGRSRAWRWRPRGQRRRRRAAAAAAARRGATDTSAATAAAAGRAQSGWVRPRRRTSWPRNGVTASACRGRGPQQRGRWRAALVRHGRARARVGVVPAAATAQTIGG